MRQTSNGAKNTRFKHPHAHVCRHAPENPQNRAAVYDYAAHNRLPSHQRPPTAAYAPDCQTSPTFLCMGWLFEFYAGFLFWPPRGNQKLTKSLPWRPSKGEILVISDSPLGPKKEFVPRILGLKLLKTVPWSKRFGKKSRKMVGKVCQSGA